MPSSCSGADEARRSPLLLPGAKRRFALPSPPAVSQWQKRVLVVRGRSAGNRTANRCGAGLQSSSGERRGGGLAGTAAVRGGGAVGGAVSHVFSTLARVSAVGAFVSWLVCKLEALCNISDLLNVLSTTGRQSGRAWPVEVPGGQNEVEVLPKRLVVLLEISRLCSV